MLSYFGRRVEIHLARLSQFVPQHPVAIVRALHGNRVNDFKRYSIGSTTDGLKKDPDGSLTIVIQKDRPSETSNWLPAPAGSFNLTMRLLLCAGPHPRRVVPTAGSETSPVAASA
jgi:hypothetical protein